MALQTLEQSNETQHKLATARLDGIESKLKRLASMDAKLSEVTSALTTSAITQQSLADTQKAFAEKLADMKAQNTAQIEEMGMNLLTSMTKQSQIMATDRKSVV